MASVAAAGAPGGAPASQLPGEAIGSGDGRIHVIPSIAPYSLKNGETLNVTAIVRSERPVATVTADLAGLVTVTLQPNARLGGVSAEGTTGIWTAEWVASGLEEKVYAATLTVTDVDGHAWTDHSLTFSDPAAGNSTPGTTAYPNAGMAHVVGLTLAEPEPTLQSAVIDTVSGYAYFGTRTAPGRVVKVALGAGSNPPTRIGAVTLNTGENDLLCAVIDAASGYAYFGTWTIPGRVVKVALGEGSNPPTRVGAVTLDPGENNLYSAVIDAASGYAYFGAATSPGRVVKVALGAGSNPPTRVGAVTLNTGEDFLYSAVIDAASGHAYFGTGGGGRVVKVALGAGSDPPTRVGAVTLNTGENFLYSAVIDVASGHAYFGTGGGRVVKLALGAGSDPPTRLGAVTLATGELNLFSAVIDTANGHAYFGTTSSLESPGRVVKVALGAGTDPPTRIGAATLDTWEYNPFTAVIDAANGHAYFGTWTNTGRVVKVALGAGSDPPIRVGAVTLDTGENNLRSAVIDAASGYAYFGTTSSLESPGRVAKVALGAGSDPPTRIGALTLETGENNLHSAVIDAASGYAYFGISASPGRVVKVSLGAGSDPPTRVGAVTLDPGENNLYSAVIDPTHGHAYFGTEIVLGIGDPFSRVVKVALGQGSDPPTRVGAASLLAGESLLRSAVIDTASGYAYFGTSTSPGRVVKVALGAGSDPPIRVGGVMLAIGEKDLGSAVIDVASGHAYFGTGTFPSQVVKVALGAGSDPPTRIGAVTLATGETNLNAAVIDAASGHAYFGTSTLPGRVVKVALGVGSALPKRVGAVTLANGENYFNSAVIDVASGHALFGTFTVPGRVVKVALAGNQQGQLKATRFTIPETGIVTEARFFSHAASGNVRLALYDNAEPKNLLWESGAVANTAEGADLIVPIGEGTPASLQLTAGTYWAAWQVDTTADVPSYTPGAAGEGFTFSQPFGPAPATLAEGNIAITSERWTEYVTYNITMLGLVVR